MTYQHQLRIATGTLLSLLGVAPAALAQCNPQLTKLVGTGLAGTPLFGNAVGLSADGGTLLVGARNDAAGIGAVEVFTRAGTVWSQQGPKITPVGYVGSPQYGWSVALSADGNTGAVGANGENVGVGAVYIIVRSGSVWSQQARLLSTGGSGARQFGYRVALSADGNTLLAAAPFDTSNNGAAYAFVRAGTVWSQQQRLTPSFSVGAGQYGTSVALSADGNTALIGAPTDNTDRGAAYVAVRAGTVWTQQSRLTSGIVTVSARYGTSVALSADGNTALIGAPNDTASGGSANIHTRSGTSWFMQQRIAGSGTATFFGSSVSLSPDGDYAALSASGELACVFGRFGTTWTQLGAPVPTTGAIGTGGFPASLSFGPGMFVGGAPSDNTSQGAAYVFAVSPAAAFVTQPSGATISAGGGTMFTVGAESLAPITYLWRRNGVNLSDGLTPGGSTVSGTTSPTLTLSAAAAGDSGAAFDCVASTTCGSTTSSPAGLVVNVTPPVYCIADLGIQGGQFGHDGLLNNNDFVVFIDAFFNNTGCPMNPHLTPAGLWGCLSS